MTDEQVEDMLEYCPGIRKEDVLALIKQQRDEIAKLEAENAEQDQAILNALHHMKVVRAEGRAEAIREVFEKIDTILRKYYETCSDSSELELLGLIHHAERFIINEMWDEITSLKKEMTEEQK